jgi:hypothetical protein
MSIGSLLQSTGCCVSTPRTCSPRLFMLFPSPLLHVRNAVSSCPGRFHNLSGSRCTTSAEGRSHTNLARNPAVDATALAHHACKLDAIAISDPRVEGKTPETPTVLVLRGAVRQGYSAGHVDLYIVYITCLFFKLSATSPASCFRSTWSGSLVTHGSQAHSILSSVV